MKASRSPLRPVRKGDRFTPDERRAARKLDDRRMAKRALDADGLQRAVAAEKSDDSDHGVGFEKGKGRRRVTGQLRPEMA
jgi:hypothetical protein